MEAAGIKQAEEEAAVRKQEIIDNLTQAEK